MYWTEEQYQEYLKRTGKQDMQVKYKKNNKYNAIPCELDGIKFKSQKERDRYAELRLLVAAGIIQKVEYEPDKFVLAVGITYTPDFKLTYIDHVEYEETKGFWTDSSKIKMRLFKEKYPKIIIKII